MKLQKDVGGSACYSCRISSASLATAIFGFFSHFKLFTLIKEGYHFSLKAHLLSCYEHCHIRKVTSIVYKSFHFFNIDHHSHHPLVCHQPVEFNPPSFLFRGFVASLVHICHGHLASSSGASHAL